MNDMTTPTCSTDGDIMVRPIRSATISSMDPKAADAKRFEEPYVRGVEITISAGHFVAETDKSRRERTHADAADADKMTLHCTCIVRCS